MGIAQALAVVVLTGGVEGIFCFRYQYGRPRYRQPPAFIGPMAMWVSSVEIYGDGCLACGRYTLYSDYTRSNTTFTAGLCLQDCRRQRSVFMTTVGEPGERMSAKESAYTVSQPLGEGGVRDVGRKEAMFADGVLHA